MTIIRSYVLADCKKDYSLEAMYVNNNLRECRITSTVGMGV